MGGTCILCGIRSADGRPVRQLGHLGSSAVCFFFFFPTLTIFLLTIGYGVTPVFTQIHLKVTNVRL